MKRWTPQVELCPPQEREPALEVLYQRMPDPLRSHLVADVLDEASSGRLDLSGLWIARRQAWMSGAGSGSHQIIGALLSQSLAGRAAAVWAPQIRPSLRRSRIAAALVRSALARFQASGIRIVQALLDESANHQGAKDLALGGMRRVTELVYLERSTKIPLPRASDSSTVNLSWRTFDLAREAEFYELLQSTYKSSLDMPELEGMRSLDDIMAGHRATGQFMPEMWQLGQVPGEAEAAAVLLLAEIPQRDAWEIVYLGLTPAARGRGLGRAVLAHALQLARPHVSRIELAVDVRNHPATRLYEAVGFVPFDRRSVHLIVFPAQAQ